MLTDDLITLIDELYIEEQQLCKELKVPNISVGNDEMLTTIDGEEQVIPACEVIHAIAAILKKNNGDEGDLSSNALKVADSFELKEHGLASILRTVYIYADVKDAEGDGDYKRGFIAAMSQIRQLTKFMTVLEKNSSWMESDDGK